MQTFEQTSFKRSQTGVDEKIKALQETLQRLESNEVFHALPLNKAHLHRMVHQLGLDIRHKAELLKEKEDDLLAHIQDYPRDLKEQVDAGLIEPLTISRCIGYYGCQDDNGFIHANPNLEHSLNGLKQQITNYLVEKTELQLLKRSLKLLQNVQETMAADQPNDAILQNAAEAFVRSLTAKRAYSQDHPHLAAFIVFEAIEKLRLRQDQVSYIEALIDPKLKSVEFQSPTGSGKTHVLMILLLRFMIDGDCTTMISTPTALAADQIDHLRRVFRKVFSLKVQHLKFNREAISDIKYLEWFNEQLQKASKEKRITLVDITSLYGMSGLALKQSLLDFTPAVLARSSWSIINFIQYLEEKFLKLLEVLQIKFQDVSKHTLELVKTLEVLRTKVSIFIDESGECLKLLTHNRYARGKARPVEESICIQSAKLYHEIILCEEIVNRWKFDFLPQKSGKITLTEQNWPILQKELADIIIKNEKFNPLLKEHLIGGSGQEAKELIEKLSTEDQVRYNWFRSQLTDYLKFTLLNKYRDGYVLDENMVAVPMHAGEIKRLSEFGSLSCLLNLTIQGGLRDGLTVRTLELMNSYVRKQRLYNHYSMGRDPICRLYGRLTQYDLAVNARTAVDINELDVGNALKYLNSEAGLQDRLEMITFLILPTIKIYPEQITSTNFSLVGNLMHRMIAVSATIDPNVSYPHVSSMAQLSAGMGNLLAVLKNSNLCIVSEKPYEMFKFILENGYRVVIDGEGHFRDLSIKEMRQMIFERNSDIAGFSYYDENGRCMIYEREAKEPILRDESRLLPEQIFIFISKSKSIGTDTPMSPLAKGIVTIGRDTCESFFSQAIGRMRGLETGQTLDLLITREDAEIIREFSRERECTVKLALRYFKFFDSQNEGKHYFFSLGTYLKELVEKNLWKHLGNPKKLGNMAKRLQSVLIETTQRNPLAGLYNAQTEIDTVDAVRLLKESILNPLRTQSLRGVMNIAEIEAAFDGYVNFAKLPDTITVGDCQSRESIVEVENVCVNVHEMNMSLDQEVQSEQSMDGEYITITPAELKSWDGNYVRLFKDRLDRPDRVILGIPLFFSPNFFCLDRDRDLREKVRKPAYQCILKIDDRGRAQLLFVDIHDADCVIKHIKEQKEQNAFYDDAEYHLISSELVMLSISRKPLVRFSEIKDRLQDETQFDKIGLISKILNCSEFILETERTWLEHAFKDGLSDANEFMDFVREHYALWPVLRNIHNQINDCKGEKV